MEEFAIMIEDRETGDEVLATIWMSEKELKEEVKANYEGKEFLVVKKVNPDRFKPNRLLDDLLEGCKRRQEEYNERVLRPRLQKMKDILEK